MKSRKHAFTLIELLIVVAIIGILAAIAVPNFLNAQMRSNIARVRSDQRSIALALDMYHLDNNVYLITRAGASEFYELTTPIAYLASVPPDIFLPTTGSSGYFSRNPDDRFPTFDYSSNDGWGKITTAPHAFLMESVGPDRIHLHDVHAYWWQYKGSPPGDRYNRYIYDGSNGLISFGSIIRTGGQSQPQVNYNQ